MSSYLGQVITVAAFGFESNQCHRRVIVFPVCYCLHCDDSIYETIQDGDWQRFALLECFFCLFSVKTFLLNFSLIPQID